MKGAVTSPGNLGYEDVTMRTRIYGVWTRGSSRRRGRTP
jgi:hypothetical protein